VHVVKLILGPQLFFELGPSAARKNGIEVCLIKKKEKKKLVLQHVLQRWATMAAPSLQWSSVILCRRHDMFSSAASYSTHAGSKPATARLVARTLVLHARRRPAASPATSGRACSRAHGGCPGDRTGSYHPVFCLFVWSLKRGRTAKPRRVGEASALVTSYLSSLLWSFQWTQELPPPFCRWLQQGC